MHATNEKYSPRFIEGKLEIFKSLWRFNEAMELEVYAPDKSLAIHEEYCQAYGLKDTIFEECTETRYGLRAKQAHRLIQKDYDYE